MSDAVRATSERLPPYAPPAVTSHAQGEIHTCPYCGAEEEVVFAAVFQVCAAGADCTPEPWRCPSCDADQGTDEAVALGLLRAADADAAVQHTRALRTNPHPLWALARDVIASASLDLADTIAVQAQLGKFPGDVTGTHQRVLTATLVTSSGEMRELIVEVVEPAPQECRCALPHEKPGFITPALTAGSAVQPLREFARDVLSRLEMEPQPHE